MLIRYDVISSHATSPPRPLDAVSPHAAADADAMLPLRLTRAAAAAAADADYAAVIFFLMPIFRHADD